MVAGEKILEERLPDASVDVNKPALPDRKSIYVNIPPPKLANSTYAKYQEKLCYWCDRGFGGVIPIVPIVIPCEW